MIAVVDDNGQIRNVVTVKQAAAMLRQTVGTIELYLGDGRLEGKKVVRRSQAKIVQYVFADSMQKLQNALKTPLSSRNLIDELPRYDGTTPVLTLHQTAEFLNCGKTVIRKYLRHKLLKGFVGFDETIKKERLLISVESIENFKPETDRRGGRPQGAKDLTVDRTARRRAGKQNAQNPRRPHKRERPRGRKIQPRLKGEPDE